jgi:hypothetical protein
MRVASWVFVACAVLGATGMFLPAIEVEGLGAHGGQSLYRLGRDRALAKRLLARYRAHRAIAEKTSDSALHHSTKRAKQLHVDDARDAMSTLDDITDDDVAHATLALSILVWTFVVMEIGAIALVAPATQGPIRRRRAIGAVVLAGVIAVIAVAVWWGRNFALDEIDLDQLAAGPGPFVAVAAAVGALAAAVFIVVKQPRKK